VSALADGLELPSLSLVPGWLTTSAHWWGPTGLAVAIRQHVVYTVAAVVVAVLIALPIGLLVGHTGRGVVLVVGLANGLRAVPGFGLLLLLVVLLTPKIHHTHAVSGLVPTGGLPYLVPVEIVLVVLAIPPILVNTYAGVQGVDPDVRDAARGMGMSGARVVRQVELPIALPLILAGVRSSVLQVIATATVAGFVPFLGGLGGVIFNGISQINDPDAGYPASVSAGIVVAALAVLSDLLLLGVQRLVVSRGVSERFVSRDVTAPELAAAPLAEVSPRS
jgi:osmoprotectant transport system permease protein